MEEGRSIRTGTITSVDQTTVDIQVAGSPRSILDVAIVGGTSNIAVGDKVLLYRTGAEVYAMSAGRGGGYFSSSCGSTCTAGGLTPQILYNDGGVCAGDQNLEWDEDNAAIVLNSIGMDPAISYINFGGTPGSSGYGFRVSSSGNMQFKNSGDSWTDIGSAAGSASPAGSDTEIQFNDSSSFGASSQLTWHVSEGNYVALHIDPDETDNEYGYINLGDDVGSSGMGFRVADTGELQYKEYGGSWSDFSDITSGAWLVGGNSPGADSVLGTLDNYAIDITVNNETALRIEPQTDSPNIIGGYSGNSVSGRGCVIGGGGFSGALNVISDDSRYCVISGGNNNEVKDSSVSGILSGSMNFIDNAIYSVICGGLEQEIDWGLTSAILYGAENTVSGGASFSVASGRKAQASNDGVFIWADSTNAVFQSESDNEFAVRAQGGARFITDVSGTTINGGIVIDWLSTSGAGSSSGLPDEVNVIKTAADGTLELVVGSHRAMHVVNSSMGPAITLGHEDNTIGSTGSDIYGSVILGGGGPTISGWANTIIDSRMSTIAGGYVNYINDADAAFIGGGRGNTVSADYGAAMGRWATASHEGVFIWGDSTGEEFTSVTSKEFAVRAQNGLRVAYDNDNYFVVEPSSSGNIDFDITGEGATPAFRFNDDLGVWGTFTVQNGNTGVFTGETRWYDGVNYFGLQAAVSSDNTTYTWPSSDGAANQVLSTDGSGILQWISSSSVGSASDFVAGSDTEIQYNDGNDFGASSDLTWDDVNSALTVNGSVSLDDNNEVRFYDDGANYVGFEAPALSADQIWVLPETDGTSNQALVTDGSGVLSWLTVAGVGDSSTILSGLGTDNTIARWDGTDTLQDSSITISDDDNMDFPNQQTAADSTKGIIYKDGSRFIHNFRHASGDTARPEGYNTFLGIEAGNLTMGATATSTDQASYNVGIGYQVLQSNTTGYNNVGVGYQVLRSNTTGHNNVGVGYLVLQSNTTGSYNTASGLYALGSNTTGDSNTASGYSALFSNTTGEYNIAIGCQAGFYINAGTSNSTSSNSVYVGYDTRASADGNTNEIVIGYQARGNGSNTVTIGNTDVTDTYLFGNVRIEDNNELRFYDDGNNYVGFEAPALTADQIWVLPDSDGSADQFLQTDGSGNLSWASGINGGDIDLDGNDLIIDGDGDSYLHASADDVVDLVLATASGEFAVNINGSEDFKFTANQLGVLSGSRVEMWDGTSIGVTGAVQLTFDHSADPDLLELTGGHLQTDRSVYINEQSSAAGNTAAYGQIWVKDDDPNTLWFTDDGGTDHQLGGGGGGTDLTGLGTDNTIARWNGTDTLQDSGVTIDDTGNLGILSQNELRFYESTNYVGFEVPALTANQIWVLPSADGSADQVLKTDGSGNLSWTSTATGGTDLTGLGTDNTIARWDGTDTLQDSEITIDDSGNIAIPDGNKLIFGTGSDVEIYWDDAGSDFEITSISGNIQIDMTTYIDDFLFVNKLESDTEVIIGQQSSCNEFDVDHGALWVKDDDPTTLWFTDDGGTDHQLGVGSTTGTIVLLASSGWPSTTSGCADPIRRELVTNDVDIYTAAFDKDSDEYMQWSMVMPDDYDGGTITAAFHWTTQSGGAAETVEWALQGVAFADDGALDASWGTAQTVSDTWIADDDLHITSDTSAITLAGSPAGGQLVQFRAYRDVSADDLGGDAELIAVKVEYTRG